MEAAQLTIDAGRVTRRCLAEGQFTREAELDLTSKNTIWGDKTNLGVQVLLFVAMFSMAVMELVAVGLLLLAYSSLCDDLYH